MRLFVHVAGRRFEVDVDEGGVRVDGEPFDLDLGPRGEGVRSVLVGDVSRRVIARRAKGGRWRLAVAGSWFEADVLDPGQEAVREVRKAATVGGGPEPLRAPMPGLVIRVETEPGAPVETGDGLLIVEAMKMENELKAVGPGRVRSVLVCDGDTVEKGQVLVEFEREEQ